MSVEFDDPNKSFVDVLRDSVATIQGDYMTLGELIEKIGEQGLLIFCMVLTLPFLFPVSIPGVSTVFGLAILLVGISVTANRVLWLPARLKSRQIATERLIPVLKRGADVLTRFQRFVRPRLSILTQTAAINRLNGLVLVLAAMLLMVPFGLVPFSNTLPAIAILFLAIGMLQRDGVFILLGYIFVVLTVVYFGALFAAAILAGQGVMSLLGSGTIILLFPFS
jgi:hypothetical protein